MGGIRCSCGGGCATFGECMRRKRVRVGYCRSTFGLDSTRDKNLTRELDLYRDARRQGVQPAGTTTAATRFALDNSDKLGKAWDAGRVGLA